MSRAQRAENCLRAGKVAAYAALIAAVVSAAALGGQPPTTAQTPPSPQAAAPIDLTGTWVAIVNEDWRWRMVTPPKGDYTSVPLSAAGKALADTWTPALDGSCKAYGVGGLMRIPTRLRISWEGGNILKIETDAGMQTRRLLFAAPSQDGPKTLQGISVARWERPAPPAVGQGGYDASVTAAGGTLRVETRHHTGGWLRKNGVPYSEDARIVEFFDRWPGPDGAQWMSVTTRVEDPANLEVPFVTSSHFRKEANDAKWRPKPCTPS